MFDIQLTKQAAKDAVQIERAGMKLKATELLRIIRENPYITPPSYEKLKGDYTGAYSRRINKQHRLVYQVLSNTQDLRNADGEPYEGVVKVIRMWTHYE